MELWSAILLGLAGSLHCAGMCGPLLLALAKARPRSMRESAGRLCYHGGRVASYCLLGWMLGLLGQFAAPAGFQRWLSFTLGLVLVAGLLAAAKIPITAPVIKWVTLLRGWMGALLQRNSVAAQAAMGAINGLLPCGLVYVAAAGATATGHPLAGAAYMACFGLGTWPVMLGLHLAGQRIPLPAGLSLAAVTRGAVWLMAVLLILRGLQLGIPYVSPALSIATGGIGCCH
jgi:sulfite exporter TauE/SafE